MDGIIKTRWLTGIIGITTIILMVNAFNIIDHFMNLNSKQTLECWYLSEFIFGVIAFTNTFIFINSFFRIFENEYGQRCYDKNNFWWKSMKIIWGNAWTNDISLCKSHWLTASVVCTISFFIIIFSTTLNTAWSMFYIFLKNFNASTLFTLTFFKHTMLSVLIATGIILGLILISKFISYLVKKYTSFAGFICFLFVLFLFIIVCGIIIYVPTMFMINSGYTPGEAESFWAKRLFFYVLPGIMMFYFTVKWAFTKIHALTQTSLGQWFRAKYRKVCPILISCEYKPTK